tara:strand:- start:2175 stop:2540 length:366 start_codon:yes stop_codon:yes gene_type:complete
MIVNTLDAYTCAIASFSGPILVQFGSPSCVKCGPFSASIARLSDEYQFEHIYISTPDAPELVEEFEVARLPAFVLLQNKDQSAVSVVQSADPDTLIDAVSNGCSPKYAKRCLPKLDLDAEF